MKIDMEQFLALTVALGCSGAVGYAVYADRSADDEFIAAVEAVEDSVTEEAPAPSTAEEVASATAAAAPTPAEPTDLDDAAGIPPVIPEDPDGYAPGPTTEADQWQ